MSGFRFVALLFVFPTLLFAANQLNCTQTSKWSLLGTRQYCTWTDMKLLSQLGVSDVHCAPTSLTMVISTLVEGGVEYTSDSWVAQNYVDKSNKDRIRLMGELLETEQPSGTDSYKTKTKTKELAKNFVGAVGGSFNAGQFLHDNDFFINQVDKRFVSLIGYGHYKQQCEKVGDFKLCSFSRDGGHAIAVNGYQTRKDKKHIIFYDPWGGVTKKYSIKMVPNNSTALEDTGLIVDLRPYFNKTSMIYKTFSKYKIIDYSTGIQSN